MSGLLSGSGVDTVRFRWRPEKPEDNVYPIFGQSHRQSRFDRPSSYRMGERGEKYVQTPLGRVGVYPDGLVYLEGRAAAIRHWQQDNHDLLPPSDLTSAELGAQEWVSNHIVELSDTPATLGRIDLASELRFSDGQEGSAFLHSLAGLDVPWCKSRVDGKKGGNVETVSFHGTRGRTIYLRAYDKGIESGSDGPGVRIRVERQKRYRKDREPTASSLNVVDLRKIYWGREFDKLVDLPIATIADLRGCLMAIYEWAETPQQAMRLAGFALLGEMLRDEMHDSMFYRYKSELRQIGVFYDPTQLERLEVPVGQYLQTLGAAWAA